MPWTPLIVQPGVQAVTTKLSGQGVWNTSNLIRYFQGNLQKLGGWVALTTQTVTGICRGILGFQGLDGTQYLALGTNERLEIYSNGSLYDITPIIKTSNVSTPFTTISATPSVNVADTANGVDVGDAINIVTMASVGGIILQGFYAVDAIVDPDNYTITASVDAASSVTGGLTMAFTTTMSSSIVAVVLANHGLQVGDTITVNVSTVVGGLTLLGDYIVATTPDANDFTFDAGSSASSSASASENGGNVRIEYLLTPGAVSESNTAAFGLGPYGDGPYGVGSTTGAVQPLRQWAMAAWGEFLIASYTNGGIYVWMPAGGTTNNPAMLITLAPASNAWIFLAMPQRQIVALGCTDPDTMLQDPLLIRWCDVDDYTDWIGTSDNEAGSFRLPTGNRIVGGLQGPQQGLIWTDLSLWIMQYIQAPLIYGFTEVANSFGLIAARACGIVNNLVIWVMHNNFFVYDGTQARMLPCSVWDFFFRNYYITQQDKICMGVNTLFNEFFVFFPSATGDGEVDSYVKCNMENPAQPAWDYGLLARTAWTDLSTYENPIGVGADGLIYSHENGNNANGVAMDSWAETGWFRISDGLLYIFVERFIPDFILSENSQVQITVSIADYPGDTPRDYGPFLVTSETEYVIVRARGRLMSLRIESVDLGSFWRLGQSLYSGEAAGRR